MEEGILLSIDELPGNGPYETEDKAYWGLVGRHALVVALFSYWIYDDIQQGFWKSTILYAAVVLYSLVKAIYELQFTYVNFIPRESIHYIKVQEAIPLVRVNSIIVHFSKNGKQAKRLIPMPGYLNKPKESMEKALEILKAEKLYVPGADDSQLIDSI